MTDKNDNDEPPSKHERLIDIQLRDAELVYERRKVAAAQEDETHAARVRQQAAHDEHNAAVPGMRAVDLAERQARTRADEDVVDYRAKLLAIEAATAMRNDRWIAAIERMAAASERDAEAQGRIASALEHIASRGDA